MLLFNDTEQPLTQISPGRHYSTLNISETVQDRDRGGAEEKGKGWEGMGGQERGGEGDRREEVREGQKGGEEGMPPSQCRIKAYRGPWPEFSRGP